MPGYHYRCEGECEGYTYVVQPLSAEPLQDCPACGEPCRRAIVREGMPSVNTFCPAFDTGYYSSLAKKPNDPEAHVSGPHSLQRLIDKRKAEGWNVSKGEPDVVNAVTERRKELKAKRMEWRKRELGI